MQERAAEGITHVHALLSALRVAQQHGKAGIPVGAVSPADPADHVGIVEIILLLAVGVGVPQHDQLLQVRDQGTTLSRVSVEIRVEYAGDAILPQQDDGVRDLLEPVADKGLETLPVLRIMVVHEGDGIARPRRYQRVLQQVADVIGSAALGRIEEMIVQRHVEEGHGVVHAVQVVQEPPQISAPVFADGRDLPAGLTADLLQQIPVEREINMLDRVQTERVHVRGAQVPGEPFLCFFFDLRVAHVHIHAHEIVEVPLFGIGLRAPLSAGEPVDVALLLCQLIPVRA